MFLADELPALGAKIYKVERSGQEIYKVERTEDIYEVERTEEMYKVQRVGEERSNLKVNQRLTDNRSRVRMSYDHSEHAFKIHDGNREITLEDDFLYYKAKVGINDKPEHRASGAYIFR